MDSHQQLLNACELLKTCPADVKSVASELNVKGELWKITCLKMSSVTSVLLGFSSRAVVCWPENAVVQHLKWTAPLLPVIAAFFTTQIGVVQIIQFSAFSSLFHRSTMSLNLALKIETTSKMAPKLSEFCNRCLSERKEGTNA